MIGCFLFILASVPGLAACIGGPKAVNETYEPFRIAKTPAEGSSRKLALDRRVSGSPIGQHVNEIVEDDQGSLWVATDSDGVW